MNKVFGSKYAFLTVCRGKNPDSLGMTIDYSLHNKINIFTCDYIEGFIRDIPSSLKGNIVNSDPNHLFEVGYDAPMLHPTDSNIYFYHMMQLLWLAKIISTDLLLELSYLNTCVQLSNIHDWKKLAYNCKYFHSTRHLTLILEGDNINSIK